MKNKSSLVPFTLIKATAIPFILFSTTSQTHANDGVQVNSDGGLELSITANRTPQEISKSLVATTVITKEEIQKYQASSVAEVLRRVPSVSVKNDGGAGKNTSISIRGTSSKHVLLLVDGIKVGSATLGSASFQHLPVSQIERIEVVRGPRSSLYGSEAIGGVIQVITTKNYKTKVTPTFSLAYGSHDTLDMSFGLSGGDSSNWYQFGTGVKKTNGFDSKDDTEVDKDGYLQKSLNLNAGHRFDNGLQAELNILDTRGDTKYDGFVNKTDFNNRTVSTKLSGRINDKIQLSGVLGTQLDESDNFKDNKATSAFTTKTNSASLLTDININANNTLLLGVDASKDKVSGTTNYSIKSRSNKAVFASLLSTISDNDLELSLRSDDNQQFGNHATGSIALGHNFTNGFKLRTSFGSAFKAPTFNDLYYPDSGNSALKPEESKNFEIGLSRNTSTGIWSSNLFQNEISNMIDWAPIDPTDPNSPWKPANVDAVKIQGIELEHKLNLANWSVNTAMSYLKPEVDEGINKGKTLRYRPQKLLSMDIDRRFGKFNLGTTIKAASESYTDKANSLSLGGYATLDLRTEYALSKDLSLGLKIGNVLDKNYRTNKGYNQDGVNGMLSIKYSPKNAN